MSGLYLDDSGKTIVSQYHNTTHWEDGTFNNGTWWGGHFEKGKFNYGNWYGGVFGTNIDDSFYGNTTWENGFWYDGLWLNGIFKSGMFLGGMWMNGYFYNGFMVGQFNGVFTPDMKINVIPQPLPPPPNPITPSLPPIVSSQYTYMIDSTIAIVGVVSSTGDTQTTRGICYSMKNKLPTIKEEVIENTGATSGYTCIISDIILNKIYYIRAWATNQMGTVYGNVLSSPYPYVSTIGATEITPNSVKLHGNLIANGSWNTTTIISGFKCSTNPNLSDPIITGTTEFAPYEFSLTISKLSPSTIYYYSAISKNGDNYTSIISSNPLYFTTLSEIPD